MKAITIKQPWAIEMGIIESNCRSYFTHIKIAAGGLISNKYSKLSSFNKEVIQSYMIESIKEGNAHKFAAAALVLISKEYSLTLFEEE